MQTVINDDFGALSLTLYYRPKFGGAVRLHNVDEPQRIGTFGRLRMTVEKTEIDCGVRVQTTHERGANEYRVGLLVPSTEVKSRIALQHLTSLLQRQQLRRLRKSA